ncbi:MAG: hypothetical protein LBV19_09725 [Streptococcaceae bacterium]|nr:hypothetical protein [Streptococcaceae bacterium]
MSEILRRNTPSYTGGGNLSAARRKIINPEALPNWQNVEIDESKLTSYALNMDHPVGRPKAIEFHDRLGFTNLNYRALVNQIIQQLPFYKAIKSRMTPDGQSYVVVMPVSGYNGENAKILAFFIDDKNLGHPRLSNVRIAHGKDTSKWN